MHARAVLAIPVLLVALFIAWVAPPDPRMEPDVRCPASPLLLAAELGAYIAEASAAAVAERGKFVVALSGGSLPQAIAGALVAAAANSSLPPIAYEAWLVVYADERIVPLDHADSNHRACVAALTAFPIAKSQFVAIDPTLEPSECAREYEARLRTALRSPELSDTPALDLVLLGMGPDGHTASLFPGHALLRELSVLVAPISDSPKPPPRRVTLTLRAINHAHRVAFVATGESKAAALAEVLAPPAASEAPPPGPAPLPCALVRQADVRPPTWFVDAAAVSALPAATRAVWAGARHA